MIVWVIRLLGLVLIIAIAVFLYLRNREASRRMARRNRIAEKQEEIINTLHLHAKHEAGDAPPGEDEQSHV